MTSPLAPYAGAPNVSNLGGHPTKDRAAIGAMRDRLVKSIEINPHIPPIGPRSGTIKWLKDEMEHQCGFRISLMSISNYLNAHSMPSLESAKALAHVLKVDWQWLLTGTGEQRKAKLATAQNALAEGAVNLVAGLIQMAGGVVAFPEEDDKRAQKAHIDLIAIIRGVSYNLHVVLGFRDGDTLSFRAPRTEGTVIIGVAPRGDDPFAFELVQVMPEAFEAAAFKQGEFEISAPLGDLLKPVLSFKERL